MFSKISALFYFNCEEFLQNVGSNHAEKLNETHDSTVTTYSSENTHPNCGITRSRVILTKDKKINRHENFPPAMESYRM